MLAMSVKSTARCRLSCMMQTSWQHDQTTRIGMTVDLRKNKASTSKWETWSSSRQVTGFATANCIARHNTNTSGGKPNEGSNLGFSLLTHAVSCRSAKQTYIARYLTDFPGPQVYKDPTDGTLLYVESD